MSTTMLGSKCDIPFYVTATALGKLGNPEGEVVLTRGAHKHNVIQMIPTLASCSFDEIMDEAKDGQVQWLQLYVNKDREVTKRIVQHAEKRGCKGLFITVDAPQLGRREKDMRSKFDDVGSNVQSTGGDNVDRSQGAARAISSFIDPSLYAMSAYGLPGVDRAMQLLKDEMEMNMRLIGASSIADLNPSMLDTRGLSMHTATVPHDTLGMNVYDPLIGPQESVVKAKAKL